MIVKLAVMFTDLTNPDYSTEGNNNRKSHFYF